MSKTIRSICSLAVGIATTATAVAATDFTFPGTLCNPTTSTDSSRIKYTQFGVNNETTNAAAVDCGASLATGATVKKVEVTFYDRHTSANFVCSIILLDKAGNTLNSSNMTTTGSGSPAVTSSITYSGVSAAMVNIHCTLPPVTSGGAQSHLASYRIQTE
jgi:hypothetical protein